jgi:hypothetical protein
MTIPEEFLKLTRGFHQGIEQVATSIDDVIDIAMSFVEPSELPVIKAYLDELFAIPPEPRFLQKLWHATRAEIHFSSDADLVKVFDLLRSRLAKVGA